jgi:hypothetical protein
VTWRQGTRAPLTSRFHAVRVRPAHRDYWRAEARPEEWLLIGGPARRAHEVLPVDPAARHADRDARPDGEATVAHRRDYEELKDEIGLDHYEGRGWRGFHHHATLCIAAYGFLAVERGLFSPSGVSLLGLPFQVAALPPGFRPRGAPDPTAATRPGIDRDDARPNRSRASRGDPTVPLLPKSSRNAGSRSH